MENSDRPVAMEVTPKMVTLRARMPDGSLWDINGEELMKRKSAITIMDLRAAGNVDESNVILTFMKIDERLLVDFNSDPEKALLSWASSLEWSHIKDVAKRLNSDEPDHTLGWRLGAKEIFKL